MDDRIYVVAQAGEEQAMAVLGPCGRDGVLLAMECLDDRYCWADPHGPYVWTDGDCLDVYAIAPGASDQKALNTLLADLGAVRVGGIMPESEIDA